MPDRFLRAAALKNEGEPAPFDEAFPDERPLPRGHGLMMRPADHVGGLAWYIVRDKFCSYDIDDPEAAVWTLSRVPNETGWCTDSGFGGYGLIYADAYELAACANAHLL